MKKRTLRVAFESVAFEVLLFVELHILVGSLPRLKINVGDFRAVFRLKQLPYPFWRDHLASTWAGRFRSRCHAFGHFS